jgi:hypothetical protein
MAGIRELGAIPNYRETQLNSQANEGNKVLKKVIRFEINK